jgi:hypothetical protein
MFLFFEKELDVNGSKQEACLGILMTMILSMG